MSHPQAYFSSSEVLAASPGLERLADALPRADTLRVSEVEGLGLVAARTVDGFTHAVAGLDGLLGIQLWDAPHWRTDPGPVELPALEPGPLDLARALEVLADAPEGVATTLLDAALAGAVAFTDPDPERRAAWIAWISFALPPAQAARLTFTTDHPDPAVQVSASAEAEGAIDATQPSAAEPSLYARAALELARRGDLTAALAHLEAADGVALAVHGGATHLIAPDELPRALALITELAERGHVHEAARAASALPSPSAALVPAPVVPAPVVIEEAEPEPIEAEVVPEPFQFARVEREPIMEAEVVPEVEPEAPAEAAEALPDTDAWSSLLSELKTESVEPEPEPDPVEPEPPEVEPDIVEASYELGISLEAFAASLAPEVPPVELKEFEVRMSLAEFEASLKPRKEP